MGEKDRERERIREREKGVTSSISFFPPSERKERENDDGERKACFSLAR